MKIVNKDRTSLSVFCFLGFFFLVCLFVCLFWPQAPRHLAWCCPHQEVGTPGYLGQERTVSPWRSGLRWPGCCLTQIRHRSGVLCISLVRFPCLPPAAGFDNCETMEFGGHGRRFSVTLTDLLLNSEGNRPRGAGVGQSHGQGRSWQQGQPRPGLTLGLHVNRLPSEETIPVPRGSPHPNLTNLSRGPHPRSWQGRSRGADLS